MPFIGNQPAKVPLTSADITDGIIVNADISSTAGITLNKLSGNPNFRNRIINGDMQIDQRNAGASVTSSSGTQYLVDRWRSNLSQSSKLSFQQNGGAVTPPTNFVNYIGITSLSAYTTTVSDYFQFEQFIEGLNVSDLNFGTANAKTITISFYARSSLTGNFGLFLTNSAANRVYPTSYTINSANTWELKTITIAGDTSGTWLKTNGVGIRICFNIAYGSNYIGTGNAWNAGTIFQPSGCQNLVGTNGATLYITGVQLEAGTSATDFEFLPYDVSLGRCLRYFQKTYDLATAPATNTDQQKLEMCITSDPGNNAVFSVSYKVPLRTTPTITFYKGTGTSGSWSYERSGASGDATMTAYAGRYGENHLIAYGGVGAGYVAVKINGHYVASAEL